MTGENRSEIGAVEGMVAVINGVEGIPESYSWICPKASEGCEGARDPKLFYNYCLEGHLCPKLMESR